jgi:hypothetical protein
MKREFKRAAITGQRNGPEIMELPAILKSKNPFVCCFESESP